jgi:hypothetical protein
VSRGTSSKHEESFVNPTTAPPRGPAPRGGVLRPLRSDCPPRLASQQLNEAPPKPRKQLPVTGTPAELVLPGRVTSN